jgi:hypothetical protein
MLPGARVDRASAETINVAKIINATHQLFRSLCCKYFSLANVNASSEAQPFTLYRARGAAPSKYLGEKNRISVLPLRSLEFSVGAASAGNEGQKTRVSYN